MYTYVNTYTHVYVGINMPICYVYEYVVIFGA